MHTQQEEVENHVFSYAARRFVYQIELNGLASDLWRKTIMKKPVFEVKAKDSRTGKITDIGLSSNVVITEENILLILNDVLRDSIDKDDTFIVKVLRKWDSKDLKKAIKYFIDNRGHWIE